MDFLNPKKVIVKENSASESVVQVPAKVAGPPHSELFKHIDSADGIIAFAKASEDNYNKMAEAEGRVWGRFLTNPRVKEIRDLDIAASEKLGVNRHTFSFPEWCRTNKKKFKRGLSIGCGAGRAERSFVKAGICDQFHGVDVAVEAIDEARTLSKEAGMTNTYEVVDVNFADFGKDKYDLIIAQTCLHHLLYLEDVFKKMYEALEPNGILWLNDYVGESQFQHSAERIGFAQAIFKIIPDEYKTNKLNNQRIDPIVVRKPGTLISPFESIRSGEILPLLNKYFSPIAGRAQFSIMHLVVPVGTRAYYVNDERSMELFNQIMAYDRFLIDSGILEGTSALYVMEKRSRPL